MKLLVISRNPAFLINFTFIVLVKQVSRSSILIIANLDISSMKGTLIFMNLCSLGLISTSALGKRECTCSDNVNTYP